MFGRTTKTQALKENATNATEIAAASVKDRKFRKQVASAVAHATVARRRAKRQFGWATAIGRLNADPVLRREVRAMVASVEKALGRVEKKRSHKVRNSLLVVAGVGGAAAAVAQARK
ncbi:MAG: hypothetical protein E6G50_02100 [Actinobacteria bacterium]|nr:MAG: hypothetical protein E6G50_02100 [Actinomycetota bacterium]